MKNKVVIITGGSSGIGKALAEQIGNQGARVLITGRKQAALDETVTTLRAQNIEIESFQSDVSREEDNKAMAAKAIALWGKIDVLINNAGISMRALFEDVELDVIQQLMDINFYGTLYATKYCLPHILQSKGSIVAVSSIAGYRGLPGRVGYSASKFAIQGFMEALRTELLKKEVHVLIACPGFTSSNIRKSALVEDGSMQGESPRDESKEMSAEECAAHIYKAIIKKKKHLVLTSQGKMTVFLNKLFPGFMDKLVYNALAKEPNSPFQK